jgi:hypothetical protein
MFNRRILASLGAIMLAGYAGVALAAPVVVVSSPTSVVKCHTVQETQCLADPHGRVYGCHTVPVTECTVVSGPGSGKVAQFAPGNTGGTNGGFHHVKPLRATIPALHRR